MAWDISVPAGTDNVRDGDDVIRELKTDLQTALQAKGNFPINAASPSYHYQGDKGNTASRPSNGSGGFYFDTDLNQLLRDNNTTWDVVGSSIPKGSAMVFYQAAAPTGWTQNVTLNNRFLRVVSGSGGVVGGTWTAHTHGSGTLQYQVLGTSGIGTPDALYGFSAIGGQDPIHTNTYSATNLATTGSFTLRSTTYESVAKTWYTANPTGITSSVVHAALDHEFIDVIVCTKD